MGSGRKSYSAGHFDKRDLKLMSRQSSRSFLTSEWITSLRQKGIIISDAEIRYIPIAAVLATNCGFNDANRSSFSNGYMTLLYMSY